MAEKDRHASSKMIRLPDWLHEGLKRVADQNERPMTRELKLAIVAWCKSQGIELHEPREQEEDKPAEPQQKKPRGRPRKKPE